jgi:hypothetical protein
VPEVSNICGIVIAGSRAMTPRDVGVFEKLLYADTFRGPHSTGVFCRREHLIKGKGYVRIPMWKEAVPGPEYLETYDWTALSTGFGTTNNYPNFLVGHNRWATQGAINDVNAHPFKYGNITLVHNGTLMDQTLLPDSQNFEVDSENICHSIEKIGGDETIQKLDGAFVLIWHDSKDDTLHIIRNEERPFHLAKIVGGDWFGASEEDMLLWILARGKIPNNIDKHFECEVGTEYIFDVSTGFELVKEVKHSLPDHWTSYSAGGWGDEWYDNRYGGGRGTYSSNSRDFGAEVGNVTPISSVVTPTQGLDLHPKVNRLLREEGIKKVFGDTITFNPYEFKAYSKILEGSGMVNGCLEGEGTTYVEVQGHNVLESNYKEYNEMTGEIAGSYIRQGVLTIVVVNTVGKQKTPCSISMVTGSTGKREGLGGDALPFLPDPKIKSQYSNGRFYTEEQWTSHGRDHCGSCDSAIPFQEASDIEWYLGSPTCSDCEAIMFVCVEPREEERRYSPSFTCRSCGVYSPINVESNLENTCEVCYDWLHGLTHPEAVH